MEVYGKIGSRQLCTLEEGKDACQFDSGGPVLWQNPSTRRIVCIGMIGYGGLCADGNPTVHSKIGAHIDWIRTLTPQGLFLKIKKKYFNIYNKIFLILQDTDIARRNKKYKVINVKYDD